MEEEGEGFNPGKDVAFGSGVGRLMFPVHSPPTRLGIEQGLRGEPHRGPGCYSPDPVTQFLSSQDAVPRSKKGWYFGAQQSGRPSLVTMRDNPAPPDYQTVAVSPETAQSKKPFNSVCDRWEKGDRNADQPSPGAYEHEVILGRQVEVDEAFGYSRNLRKAVVVKCTRGIPDKCSHCKKETVGDYYQKGQKILCRQCLKKHHPTTNSSFKSGSEQYQKVRDCSDIHHHKFPGKDPKIILKCESELKKRSNREAYFRLYFSD